MRLLYEGTDITREVDVVKCIHRDVSGGRCDSMELEVENAAAWYGWKPQRDDVIAVECDGYSTGKMYLNTILPANGRYRMIATSIPGAAKRKVYRSYENARIADIMAECAAECGMECGLYGVNENITYRYVMRLHESAPAFLNRLLTREGAVLKALDGRLTAIGIEYAQALEAGQTIAVSAEQNGIEYLRREETRLSGICIRTPYAKGSAMDTDATGGIIETLTEEPANDNAQAARWARGLLLGRNRTAEEVNIGMEYNPGLSAMIRVDIISPTDIDGQWMVDEVEHDFINRRSRARLLRCIHTIG